MRSGPIVGIGDTLELFTLLQIDGPSSLGFREIPPPPTSTLQQRSNFLPLPPLAHPIAV